MAGIPAAAVSGETPLFERLRLCKALRSGEIKVLSNVQVLCEGYDEPLVDCVQALGVGDRAEILGVDVARALGVLEHRGDRFGLVLCDPPWADVPCGAVTRSLEPLGRTW